MKSCLVTECVNATSMYSRMKVTPSFGITYRLLVSRRYSTVSLFFTGMMMIHVFICVDGAFLVAHLLKMSWEYVQDFFYFSFCIFTPLSALWVDFLCPLFFLITM